MGFSSGAKADRMYIIRSGVMFYTLAEKEGFGHAGDSWHVHEGECMCEAVLWMQWRHAGKAVARARSELIAVWADKFQQLMQQELRYAWQAPRYAKLFVDNIRGGTIEWSDVIEINEHLQDLADQA